MLPAIEGQANTTDTIILEVLLQVVIPKAGTTTASELLPPLLDLVNAQKQARDSSWIMSGKCSSRSHNVDLGLDVKGAGRPWCLHHDQEYVTHQSWAEALQWTKAKGIVPRASRVVPFAILRDPVQRLVSEFTYWQRTGWRCCTHFFSTDLQRRRQNMTLRDFVLHPDCPAHNRMTWMLGAPCEEGPANRSEVLRASTFPHYWKQR